MTAAAWVCLFSPLAAAALIVAGGMRIPARVVGFLATASVAVSFAAAIVSFVVMLTRSSGDRSETSTIWTWLSAGSFHVGLNVLVDPVSVFMMLVVSGVGCLIVGYSIGYVDAVAEERRYFFYISLFVFSMLLLVEAGNLLILLGGWGLVGLCSYFLIGFEHERPAAIAAAKKAFIMNAFGDATMALSLFILVQKTNTLEWGPVFQRSQGLSETVMVLVTLGLLGGAVAKSAQLPLQTWLPDAMEGPTPVSALIHAATMVTAGVYLIVRAHPLFELAPKVQDLAAGLGAATILLAGLVALVQTDIKRVIAYSTMSQIGYMFLAAGIGAYANALFHLMTHAFFKALLFLAAGIIIHALAGEQDMRKMGGLRHQLPRTYIAFLAGGLALVAVPTFAGFFSKDSILAAALDAGWYGDVLFAAGMAGAFLTGLYTFRMIFIVFGGEPSPYAREHFHEPRHDLPAFAMAIPVAVLAFLATFGGWIQFAPFWTPISKFIDPAAPPLVEATNSYEAIASVVGVLLGLAGIAVAWLVYSRRTLRIPAARPWRALLEHKFYFDELYDYVFYKPADLVARALGTLIERPLIEGSVDEVGHETTDLGSRVSGLQTGFLRLYVLAIAVGVSLFALLFVIVK
jgi:NADH-quinone oxidoreductase subunit L